MQQAKLTAVVNTRGVKKSTVELNKFTKAANDSEMQTKKTGKSVKGLKAPFTAFISIVGKAAVAGTAFATAASAIVIASARAERELGILSRQARTATADFQAAAFATQQYGITAEQFADISKDVADKVGEFATAGTGAFQDYADVLGLTKEEAVAAAREFQGLSSQEVIGRVVSQLEAVNATGDQTTFVLESLGNDLSRLSPLFANNSKELNTLKDRYRDVNDQLQLTAGQQQSLQQVAATGSLLADSLGNAGKLISSAVAPILDDFFNDVIEIVPQAAQAVVDFLNLFKEVKDNNSIKSIEGQIDSARDSIDRLSDGYEILEQNISKLERVGIVQESVINQERRKLASISAEIQEQKNQIDILEARKKEIEEQDRLSTPSAPSGGQIGGFSGVVSAGDSNEALRKEIDNIISLNDTALDKISTQEAEQKQKIKEALKAGLINREQALDAEIAAEVNAAAKRQEITNRQVEQEERNKEAAQRRLEELLILNETELEQVDRLANERLEKLNQDYENRLIAEEQFQAAKLEIEARAEEERQTLKNDALEQEKARFEEQNKMAIELGETFSRDVSSGFVDAALAGESMSDVLLNSINNISQAIIKAALEQFIQQQIVDRLIGTTFVAQKTAETGATTAQAAQNAFAATAAIPIVGPALAPAAAATAGATAASLGAAVISAAAAREQGGMLSAGQTSLVAERGLEILTPATNSRVRTAQQMRDIMGEGNSQPNVNIVVIDQSDGNKDFEQSVSEDGEIVLLIRNTVANDLSQANSQISKAVSSNTTAQRRRA